MKKYPMLGVLLAALVMLASCGPKAPNAEQAFKTADENFSKAATPQEKVKIARDFLTAYPDGPHTSEMLDNAVSVCLEDLRKPEEAWALIRSVEFKVTDPVQLRKVTVIALPVMGKLKKSNELSTAASALASHAMTYDEHIAVANAGLDAERWDLAVNHAQSALKSATPEAFKADNPGREFAPDRLERYVNMRKAECLTDSAWAQANLGRYDDSLMNFDEARAFTVFSFVGASEPPFDLYLGKTYLMKGDYAKAVDALTPAAVFAGDPDALEAMKAAYKGLKGGDMGYAAYIEEQRARLAKAVTDFTLPDYKGASHTWSDMQKGRVMLLSFWFPT
jgi:tetratricopeptide (TPR) repeat protein